MRPVSEETSRKSRRILQRQVPKFRRRPSVEQQATNVGLQARKAGVIFSERSSALKGISRNKALSDRAMNRLQMLLSATVITAGLALAVLFPYFIFLPLSMAIIRLLIYGSRLRKIRGRIRLALLGPILDIFYSVGFLEGIIASAAGRQL